MRLRKRGCPIVLGVFRATFLLHTDDHLSHLAGSAACHNTHNLNTRYIIVDKTSPGARNHYRSAWTGL